MAYSIEFAPAAARDLKKLEPLIQRRVVSKIEQIAKSPRLPGVEKLSGDSAYRVRVGDFRIIFDIDDKVLRILVLRVGDRKQVYRR